MSETLSLYAPRPGWIHRLNPLTKLSLTGFLLVAGLSLPGLWATYALFMLLLLPLALMAQIPGELAGRAWRVTLPFAISLFLIQGFLWPGGTPVVDIGPFSLKREGLLFATAATGRILSVVGSFLFFALTTRPDHLMTALVQHGFPSSLAYVVVATVQIAPRFQERAATIRDAQRARGLETEAGLLRRLRAVFPLVVPLVLSSLVDVEERALAIEARAFSVPGEKTSLVEVGEASWEPVARWVLLAGAIGMIFFRIWWAIAD